MAIPPGQNPMAAGARRRTQVFESKQVALDKFRSKPPLNELSDDSLAAYVEYGMGTLPDGRAFLKCSGESEARTYEATGQISTQEIGGALLPIVIAAGDPAVSMLAALTPAIVDGGCRTPGTGSTQGSDTVARSKRPTASPLTYSNTSRPRPAQPADP
jgi:hypothetical protein